MPRSNELIILSGPSCVGKSPLIKSIEIHFPEFFDGFTPLILYNSREPRYGEINGKDYHFLSRESIRNKSHSEFITFEVRGDTQGLDLIELRKCLKERPVLFEGNPWVGKALIEIGEREGIPTRTIFMSPVNKTELEQEIEATGISGAERKICTLMKGKLLERTKKLKGDLKPEDFEEIKRRSGFAFRELKLAPIFEFVIPNHDGEGSKNWIINPYPEGDAALSIQAFLDACRGADNLILEKWDDSIFK